MLASAMSSANHVRLLVVALVVSCGHSADWTQGFSTDMTQAEFLDMSVYAIASSANGTKLAACGYPHGILLSCDSGASWTKADMNGVNPIWSSIASSADGTKLVVSAYSIPGGMHQDYISQITREPAGFLPPTPTEYGKASFPPVMVPSWPQSLI